MWNVWYWKIIKNSAEKKMRWSVLFEFNWNVKTSFLFFFFRNYLMVFRCSGKNDNDSTFCSFKCLHILVYFTQCSKWKKKNEHVHCAHTCKAVLYEVCALCKLICLNLKTSRLDTFQKMFGWINSAQDVQNILNPIRSYSKTDSNKTLMKNLFSRW